MSVWTAINVEAAIPGGGPSGADLCSIAPTNHVYIPPTSESPSYDADGNLTQDARWQYTWDAENRLVTVQAWPQLYGWPLLPSMWRLDFSYDAQGRRIQKVISTGYEAANYGYGHWSVGWTPVQTNRFLYDGWDLVAELTGASPSTSTLLRSYVWGTDLSGSMQGAGGVGGLLEISEISNSQITNCFAAFDGNGNVVALVSASDGVIAAQYEYGPFGEVLRATGPMAKANPFRFSTKYQDGESDLLYYGFRYYNGCTGRWLSRDPAPKRRSRNLYLFASNEPISRVDRLGLWDRQCPPPPPAPPQPPGRACCDGKTIDEGYQMLKTRWLDAANYLHQNGIGQGQIDNDGEKGVSCIDSANRILSFMSPVPRCWKCYIERRTWNYRFWDPDDENYIICEPMGSAAWRYFTMVFDWWYQTYEGYDAFYPIPMWQYTWMFPVQLDVNPLTWWTEYAPAPADDCVAKSTWKNGPENYAMFLDPIVARYGNPAGTQ